MGRATSLGDDGRASGDEARLSPATRAIETEIRSIPSGTVSTYGAVARRAGFANGARQVVRVLHARAGKAGLPWHRVLAKGRGEGTGRIALSGDGFAEQRALLLAEGVEVSAEGTVDLDRFGFASTS